MSREQVTDQQFQGEGSSNAATTTEETYGLPSVIYAQVTKLKPGNVEGLRDLLARYPDFAQGILSVASHHVGAATVRQAVGHRPLTQDEIRPGGEFELEGSAPTKPSGRLTQEQIRPGGEFELEGSAPTKPSGRLTQEQIRPGGEFELEGSAPTKPSGRLTQEQIRPGGEFELEGSAPTKPSGRLTQEQIRPGGEFELEGSAPTKPSGQLTQEQIRPGGEFELEGSAPTADPAWVASARKYNQTHAAFVEEFNDATNGQCVDADGQADPQAVARWQAAHGLAADGKIGPMTVAAARKARAQAADVTSAPQVDARPPV